MLDAALLDSLLPVFSYCEKYAGPIAQPLNFLSCAVFWLGAVWLWTRVDEDDEKPSFHHVSALLLFLLGLSGMVWHVSGNKYAFAADVFILLMLMVVVISVLCNDVLNLSLRRGLVVIVSLTFIGALLKDASFLPQNGGIFLPVLFFLAVASLKAQTISAEATVYLLSASYTLFFGLVAYSLDGIMCAYFPQGLHFLWHVMLVVSMIYISKTLASIKKEKAAA